MPNRPSLELACVFWHSRRVRIVGEGRSTAHLGLVFANPCDEFFELVSALRGKKPLRPSDATEPAVKAPPPMPRRVHPTAPTTSTTPTAPTQKPATPIGSIAKSSEPELRQFSVRVKQDGGPRSTRLVVAARDIKDAEARALAEVGDGWIALEVKRAKPQPEE